MDGDYFRLQPEVLVISKNNRIPLQIKHSRWCDVIAISNTLNADSLVCLDSSFRISGRLAYKETVFLKEPRTRDCSPSFWQVVDILSPVSNGKPVLIMKDLVTTCYSTEQFSFIVGSVECFSAISCDCLLYRIPLQSFFYKNQLHITPNYYQML